VPFWCVPRRDTILRSVDFSSIYPFKVAALLGTFTLVALAGAKRHHPFARFGSANQVTALRALFVSFTLAMVGERSTDDLAMTAAGLGVLVTSLDAVDGWLARRTAMASVFGARFDMEVDALLILALSILAWQYGKAGAWVIASGLLRYLFVLAGWVWAWLRAPLPASWRGKFICVVQIAGLVLAVSPFVPWPASALVAAASLAALVYSFLVDVVWLWRRRSDR
jgi:phosphatidylglycerophosphate synthase